MSVVVNFDGQNFPVPSLEGEDGWANLTNYLQALATGTAVKSKQTQSVRVATAQPVTVAASEWCIVVNLSSPGPSTINLPAGVTGQIFCIVDGKGDAATNAITIDPNSGEQINGASTYQIATNNGGVLIQWDGSQWRILSAFYGATPKFGTVTITTLNVTNLSGPTVTGATLDGDLNNVFDLPLTSLKTQAGDANKVLRRDAAGIPTSGNTLPNSSPLVTTDSAQTLANKTLTQALLDAANIPSFQDFDEVASPATPAAGKVRMYAKTDKKLYKKDSTGVESPIGTGGSGGINLIDNPDDSVGWGQSGTISIATISGANNPLNTVTDTAIEIGNSVAGAVNDYARYRFTVPEGLKNTPLVISVFTNSTVSNDFVVEMFSNTASNYGGTYTQINTPTNQIKSGQGQFRTFFVPDSVNLFHELRVRRAAGTSALRVTAVTVGPQSLANGAASSNGTRYQPAVNNFGAKSVTRSGVWRQNGQYMEIDLTISTDAVPAGAGGNSIDVSLPSGYSIDVQALALQIFNDGVQKVGTFQINGLNATSQFEPEGSVFPKSSTTLAFIRSGSTTSITTGDLNTARSHYISANVKVPIVGWSSNVTMFDRAVTEFAADDGTNDVFGPNGALVPNVGFSTGITTRDFVFPGTIQDTQSYVLEYKSGAGNWSAINNLYAFTRGANANSNNFYGLQGAWASSTTYTVEFGNQGTSIFASNQDNGAQSWATRFTAGDRFRVRKTGDGGAGAGPISSANITGRTDGLAPAAGILGETITLASRTTTGALGVVSVNTSAMATLTPGIWLLFANCNFPSNNSASFIGSYIALNTTVDFNRVAGVELGFNNVSTTTNGTSLALSPSGTLIVAPGTTQQLFAKSFSEDAAVNVTMGGFAVRIA